MAVHHDLAEVTVGLQELVSDPEQVLGALLLERDTRPDARVHEEIVALAMRHRETLEEASVARRQVLGELLLGLTEKRGAREHAGRLDAVAPESRVAAVHHPSPADREVLQESQHHLLMVTHERRHLQARGPVVHHPIDNRARVGSTIDVVAEENEPLGRLSMSGRILGDLREERLQQIGPAVDVAHGVEPASGDG